MTLLAIEQLRAFKDGHPDARADLDSWEEEVREAQWATPHDLKARFPKASLPGKQQAIFDIRGNRYRLWVKVSYKNGTVLIKGIGTHKEYEKWSIE